MVFIMHVTIKDRQTYDQRCLAKIGSNEGRALRKLEDRAGKTGFEPATSGVTDQHSNQLSYFPPFFTIVN